MPRLIRGVARTAVIAGTATTVSNRVSRRQANRWSQQEAAQEPAPAAPMQEAAPTAAASAPDPLAQLSELADLKERGILTDEQFAGQAMRILGR
jgi:hypothetical protein